MFVDAIVVLPPPPKPLNSITLWPVLVDLYTASICIFPTPELITEPVIVSMAVGRSLTFSVVPAALIEINPPAEWILEPCPAWAKVPIWTPVVVAVPEEL